MSTHDRRDEADRRPASPAPGTRPAAPRGILGLQASAGNAAVVQMMRQAGLLQGPQPHQHGAGCGHQGAEGSTAPVQRSAVQDVLRTGGRPLDTATRSDMEARLGADFSDVRVHDDSAAKASAAQIGARAYTSGSHVVIGDGGGDKHTLAHELTHVIQQRQGPVAGTDNGSGLSVSDPSDRFEREAEANATRVMRAPVHSGPEHPDAERLASPDAAVQRAQPGAVQRAPLPAPYSQYVDYPVGVHLVTINGIQGGVGIRMEAELDPNNIPPGESPKVKPAWWPKAGTAIGDWFRDYMVQGHLLNHNLGGSGKHLENLTPLFKQANSQHHAKVESTIKAAIQKGHMVRYHVTADFSTHPTAADLGMVAGSQEAIDFDTIYRTGIPGSITAEYTIFDSKGKDIGGSRWTIENNNL